MQKNTLLRGFTLIELLVVIAIMGILMAIITPILGKAREAGYKTKCASNLRNTVLALNAYAQDEDGTLFATIRPSGHTEHSSNAGYFAALIGPYLGMEPTSGQYVTMRNLSEEELLICPTTYREFNSRAHPHLLNCFASNGVLFTIESRNWTVNENNIDLPSKTLLMGESKFLSNSWAFQVAPPDWMRFSHASGSANLGFADGHIENEPLTNLPSSDSATSTHRDTPYVGLTFWRGQLP